MKATVRIIEIEAQGLDSQALAELLAELLAEALALPTGEQLETPAQPAPDAAPPATTAAMPRNKRRAKGQ